MALKRRFLSLSNRFGVWLYRKSDGRLAGNGKKTHVLLLTSPGRRTGIPRSTCVRYLEYDGGFLVWGTAAGASREPDWFRNLRAAAAVDAQAGRRRFVAHPHELLGDERDRVWRDVVLPQAPGVAKYERKSGRIIPVAHLVPGRLGP